MDRVYLGAPNAIAILDHEKKRTYVIRKDGLPDIGKLQYTKNSKIGNKMDFKLEQIDLFVSQK